MASSMQSNRATVEDDTPEPAASRKRARGTAKVPLRTRFGSSRHQSAQATPAGAAQRRPSTSQGPEAFNLFAARTAQTTGTQPSDDSTTGDSPAFSFAARLANRDNLPAAVHASSVATAKKPMSLADLAASHNARLVAAGHPPLSLPASFAAKCAALDARYTSSEATSKDEGPAVGEGGVSSPPLPPLPSDPATAAPEMRSRKGSLSPEQSQLIARMEQYKLERDQAVEEARVWKAHTRSLLDKMGIFAPLLPLLEEWRAVDAALSL
ncbi:hypothetical protein LTR85_005429 [Meristemomyces frigidus]|nr:hypothetical protein LTR85_005429 [Meristemomyces frigidus]